MIFGLLIGVGGINIFRIVSMIFGLLIGIGGVSIFDEFRGISENSIVNEL